MAAKCKSCFGYFSKAHPSAFDGGDVKFHRYKVHCDYHVMKIKMTTYKVLLTAIKVLAIEGEEI